jgi:hypothetical protein
VHEKILYVSGVTIFVNLTRAALTFRSLVRLSKRQGMTTQEAMIPTQPVCDVPAQLSWNNRVKFSTVENFSGEKIVY